MLRVEPPSFVSNETRVQLNFQPDVTSSAPPPPFLYATETISSVDIALGGEAVQYCDAFKYPGVILDSSLSMNQHMYDIDHVKGRKLLRC